MPLLIRTPEEILRATRKDLYFIRDMGMDAGWNAKGVKMILHWIRKNLPETPIERIEQNGRNFSVKRTYRF